MVLSNEMLLSQQFARRDRSVNSIIALVLNQAAGIPLLRVIYVQCIAEVMQDCCVQFSIHTLSSRDELLMNQPTNFKECNQHGLDIEFYLLHILCLRRWHCLPYGGHFLGFQAIFVHHDFIMDDYQEYKVWIISGSHMKVSAN